MVQLDGSEELNWNETIGYFTASFGIEKEEAADGLTRMLMTGVYRTVLGCGLYRHAH